MLAVFGAGGFTAARRQIFDLGGIWGRIDRDWPAKRIGCVECAEFVGFVVEMRVFVLHGKLATRRIRTRWQGGNEIARLGIWMWGDFAGVFVELAKQLPGCEFPGELRRIAIAAMAMTLMERLSEQFPSRIIIITSGDREGKEQSQPPHGSRTF
jgi:hypothetical protein